ncbi:N-acetyltransferase GCN5 [Sphaerisporangium krabiense]|uniref:RimJ/RimL family protein N-acetyltransferase n=1 Tax=Sphaerisporangium krabiense TaxID=763782 RepID=A0A7W8Z348_9ACTN|nr:GNAT family protein [Sphaerisporangium krabiense]MBB5626492.1 RimJ/RimL family protein N-acetyltransferase [Sphaerisporangium krabiense]GII63414.1 N-acetyltransferase GCN5 [Sphaerisporangium krabiense]
MSDEEPRLRDVEPPDLEHFLRHEHDPEAARRSRFTPRERDVFMAHWTTKVLGDPAVLVQAVTVDGEVAGNIVSWWEKDERYIGYVFGRPFWGRGIATRALALFLSLERTRPLYADPFAGNTASVRLLEKSGFRRAGAVRRGDDEQILLVLEAAEA